MSDASPIPILSARLTQLDSHVPGRPIHRDVRMRRAYTGGEGDTVITHEILKQTGCRVNQHAWTWTSSGTVKTEPREYDLCCCGQYQWRNREKSIHEVDLVEEQQ